MAHGSRSPRDQAVSAPRFDRIFLLILLAALGVRLYLAYSRPYVHDEANTSIPLSQTISFSSRHPHLPLRGENHGALPAYAVNASYELFGRKLLGRTPLAYRGLHLLLALSTIGLIYAMTSQWYGVMAGRWAAGLLSFNEYYLDVSSRATAHVPYLFLLTVALYAFARFLRTQRAVYLYGVGVSIGLAFYCKEHSALLLPLCLVVLVFPAYRRWLLSPHVYLAVVAFVVIIGPDLFWNLTTNGATATTYYGHEVKAQANYSSHLRRIGGVGFSPYPAMFYLRGPVKSLALAVTRHPLRDDTLEYHSMNPALGVLMLAAVVGATLRVTRQNQLGTWLLLVFWGVFGLFTLIRPGDPPGRLDAVSWIWVDITMMAAVIFAGSQLADLKGRWRLPVWVCSAAALVYACALLTLERIP